MNLTAIARVLFHKKGHSIPTYIRSKDFFSFHGSDSITIKQGEIAINKRLADYLGVKTGDELILRYKAISDIPADAPFAPAGESGKSTVMKIGNILKASGQEISPCRSAR